MPVFFAHTVVTVAKNKQFSAPLHATALLSAVIGRATSPLRVKKGQDPTIFRFCDISTCTQTPVVEKLPLALMGLHFGACGSATLFKLSQQENA